MIRLLQKHYPVCGIDVDKRTATKGFGKYFCSEKHADHYAQMKIERETDRGARGRRGCC
jgi:YHS domain-containing protein